MGLQRQPGDDAERPAAAAAQCEEQLRVTPCADGTDAAVSRHHLGLEQMRCADAELLGEAAEAAALDEAADADGHAAAALHVAAVLDRDLAVDLAPTAARADGDGGNARVAARRTGGAEVVPEVDPAHLVC